MVDNFTERLQTSLRVYVISMEMFVTQCLPMQSESKNLINPNTKYLMRTLISHNFNWVSQRNKARFIYGRKSKSAFSLTFFFIGKFNSIFYSTPGSLCHFFKHSKAFHSVTKKFFLRKSLSSHNYEILTFKFQNTVKTIVENSVALIDEKYK